MTDAVGGVLHEKVLETALDVVKILLVAEAQVIDRVREVKVGSILFQLHLDIAISMSGNMEISWNAINFKEAFEVAALFVFKLFLDSLLD